MFCWHSKVVYSSLWSFQRKIKKRKLKMETHRPNRKIKKNEPEQVEDTEDTAKENQST